VSDASELTLSLLRRHPEAAAQVLEELGTDAAATYLRHVPPRLSAPVLAAMLPFYAGRCLELAGESLAVAVLPLMPAAAAAAVLRRMPASLTETLLGQLPARAAFKVRLLLRYPATTIGAWMEPGTATLPEGISVYDAWMRLQRDAETLERFLFVVDRDQRLIGRIASIDLLRAPSDLAIDRLVEPAPHALAARSDLSTAADDGQWMECNARPVLAGDGRFLGVAHYAALRHAERTAADVRSRSVFGETLLELLDAYWLGLSRLIEGSLSLLPPRHTASGPGKE